MPGPFDQSVIPLQCPQCRKKTTAKLGQLKSQNQFVCPSCRARIPVKGFSKQLSSIEKSIPGMGKKIKITIKPR